MNVEQGERNTMHSINYTNVPCNVPACYLYKKMGALRLIIK